LCSAPLIDAEIPPGEKANETRLFTGDKAFHWGSGGCAKACTPPWVYVAKRVFLGGLFSMRNS
jgi:hypothetical protein